MAETLDSLVIKISAETKEAIGNLNSLANAINTLSSSMKGVDTSGMNKAAGAARQVGDAMKTMSNSAVSAEKTVSAMDKAGNALGRSSKSAQEMSTSFSNVSGSSKRVFPAVVTAIRKVDDALKGVVKSAKKAASSLMGIALSSKYGSTFAKKLAKELTRIGKMLKLMITRMILRKLILSVVDGFKNLAQYSSKFDASISLLWNGMRQLGNAIAAATSPLANAFAPALRMIIDLAIKAVNAINQLVSSLLGFSTWTRAKTLTDSYADSLKKTTGAAKELKKTVLGFDELNQLQDNSNSGGDSGVNPADMFEDMDVSDFWKKWAKKLKDMWKNADFTELGATIGEQLLKGLQSIPWGRIKETARKIGKSIATLINGFVETEGLGYEIGKTLAEALNTAFEFVNSYVHNLHWESVGKFIAETFNGFFDRIDWELIKDTVITGLKGFADSINSFVDNLDWDNISQTISNGVNTIASGIAIFFETVDWKSIGENIGTQLKKSIEQIDWQTVGRAIGDIVQSALDFFSGLISQLKWEDIKNAIQDLLEGFFTAVDTKALSKLLKGVLAAVFILGVVNLGIETAKILLVEKLKSIVVGAATSQVVTTAAASTGATIASYVIAGIVGGFAGFAIGSYLKDYVFDLSALIAKTKEESDTIKELKEHYKGLSGTVDMVRDSIKWLSGEEVTLKDETGNVIGTFESWKEINRESKQSAVDHAKSIAEVQAKLKAQSAEYARSAGIVSSSSSTMDNSLKNTQTNIKNLGTTTKTETDSMKQAYSSAATSLSGDLEKIKNDTNSTTDSVKKSFDKRNWTFSGVADGLRETFSNAVSAIKSVWNRLADDLSGTFSIGGRSFSIRLPRVYATGGFPEDGLFFANHNEMVGKFSNGRTAVANNEQITTGIAQAVYSAIMSANSSGGSGQYINNTIMVDGVAIARAVTKGQQQLDRRYSPTTV